MPGGTPPLALACETEYLSPGQNCPVGKSLSSAGLKPVPNPANRPTMGRWNPSIDCVKDRGNLCLLA